ncbi:MAG: DUF1294 domain-containing protein [Clostridia bacterium]|nr:DUF1294 domain-containing protein [Clostridia bacterium]
MKNPVVLAIVAIVLLVMNILAYALMAIDKKRARAGAWRIKERTLFLATGLFGGLGGTLGMFLLRHKTKHWYFRLGFPALLVLQVIVLVALAVLL